MSQHRFSKSSRRDILRAGICGLSMTAGAALLQSPGSSKTYVRDLQRFGGKSSVLFDEIQHSFPLLAGLLRAALENDGVLIVFDFGGEPRSAESAPLKIRRRGC
jgi:hypothetical protein